MTYIGLIEFARTPGSRDKQPRKKRNFLAEGSALGAVGLGAANRGIRKTLPSAENAAKEANRIGLLKSKIEDYQRHANKVSKKIPGGKIDTRQIRKLGLAETIKSAKRDLKSATKGLGSGSVDQHITKTGRNLRNLKLGKKVSKYGAIGLAGVAGAELARRGINKYRNRGNT